MSGPHSGGDLAARALAEAGITDLFALPGGHIYSLLAGAERAGLRTILTRHEAAAVMAAEGYALAGGGVGATAVTAGPGFTNALPGIAEANAAGVPVVVIGGRTGIERRDRGAVQDMDQLRMIATVTKWSAECLATDRIPEYVAEAVYRARAGSPGVAYLEIPQDVLGAQGDPPEGSWEMGHGRPGRPVPGPAEIDAVVALLEGAERPVVLAGSGAFFSKASDALREFIERSGIPLVTTSAARGLVDDDHPQCVGSLVHGGVALASADVSLVLGSRFNANLLYGGPPLFPPSQRVAQIDITAEHLGGSRRPAVAVVGDVTASLSALTSAWSTSRDRWSEWQGVAMRAAETSLAAWREDATGSTDGIHPGRLAEDVARFAESIGATLVADGGDTSIWGIAMARARAPGTQLYIGSAMGTLGIGLPFALGVKALRPEAPAVVFTGDGAFGLSAMELDTAARYDLPVLIVVVNNGGWGDVSHEAGAAAHNGDTGSRGEGSAMRYDVLATAVGGHPERVTTPDEVLPALERAFAAVREGRPAVVDAVCDPGAISSFMQSMGDLSLM